MRHKQHILGGVLYTLIAALCYTGMSALGKIIGNGASTSTILFARFFISLMLILPWAARFPQEIVRVQKASSLIFRSVFTFIGFLCFFYSLKYISLTDALLLNNTYPLFVPLAAWAMLGVKTPKKIWIGIVLGFIGIVLVLNPDVQLFQPQALLALLSGIFASISIILIRTLTKSASVIQILFYNFLLCTILSALVLPYQWQHFSGVTWWLLAGVGIFGMAYQFFSTLGYAKAPVRITSSLMFLCIVFAVVIDFFVWNVVPSWLSIAGIVLVILGGLLVIYFGKRELQVDTQKEEETK